MNVYTIFSNFLSQDDNTFSSSPREDAKFSVQYRAVPT